MRWSRLQYEGRLTSGVDFAAADLADQQEPGSIRYVRTTDIATQQSLTPKGVYAPRYQVPSSAVAEDGDLLFTRSGSLGTSYLHSGEAVAVAGYLVKVRLGAIHDPRFFAYWAQSRRFLDDVQVGAARSTIDNFSASKYGALATPTPPLEVQRRIADFLDTETARIDTLLATNHHAAELARQRFERAVIDGVTGNVVEGRDDMGGIWGQATRYQVGPYAMYGQTGSGHTPSRSVAEYWVDCDIPWITTGDVAPLRSGFVERIEGTRESISRLGMANSAARLHPAGTVVLSRTASVGFAGIMARPMATSQDFFTWTPDDRLDSTYLLWSLRAMKFAGHFDRLLYGSTHKTIYVPDLLPLRGPIPPIEDQQNIVAAVRSVRDLTVATLNGLREQRDLLAERRQALITAAVTGELEV